MSKIRLSTQAGGDGATSGQVPTWDGSKWVPQAPSTVTTPAFHGVKVYRSINQSIPASTWTAASWDSEVWDTDTLHDLVTNPTRITIPSAGVTHNDFMATIATVSSGEMNLATVKPDGTQRCGVQVTGGQIHLIYGALNSSGIYLGTDTWVSVASSLPSTPFTLRVALVGNVLSCWINGVLQGTTLAVDATSMLTYGASTRIGMLDTGNGHWDDFTTSDGVTVVDNFTRADTTSGLGAANTGQYWTYYP